MIRRRGARVGVVASRLVFVEVRWRVPVGARAYSQMRRRSSAGSRSSREGVLASIVELVEVWSLMRDRRSSGLIHVNVEVSRAAVDEC